jgi:hypothetical protein
VTPSRPHASAVRESRNVAIVFLAFAIAGATAIGYQMGRHLLPQPDNFIIWGLSLAVLLFGLFQASRDIVRLRREWEALDALRGRPEPNLIASKYPGTAVGDRAAQVEAANAERRVEREFRQSNRAEATALLEPIGSVTRFLSSALLVLAVMGTFAGMKGALPHLGKAIAQVGTRDGSGGGLSGGTGNITAALDLVSDAFGANFVALFGSLLLGTAAFGATLERRRFLSRLEHLSERHLYRHLPTDADASDMQKAVYELQRSVTSIADIATAIEGLGGGIGDMKTVLRDTLSEMHTSFNDSVRRHGVELQTQLNATVSELTTTLGGTTKALEATAVAYEGLVKGLEERDLGLARASTALEAGINQLQEIQGVAATAARDAAAASRDAAASTAHVTAIGAKAHELLATAGTDVMKSADRVAAMVELQVKRLAEVSRRIVEIQDQHGATRDVLVTELRLITGQVRESGHDVVSVAELLRASTAERNAELRTDLERHTTALVGEAKASDERIAKELAALRQHISTEERAAATYTTAEFEKRSQHLAQLLEQVRAATEAGAREVRATLESLKGTQSGRADQSAKTGERLVGAMESVQKEVAATRADLGALGHALLTRPISVIPAMPMPQKGDPVGADR